MIAITVIFKYYVSEIIGKRLVYPLCDRGIPYGITSEQKLDNDVYYAENISFLLDVKIFFKTILTVLKRENIYVGEASTKPAPAKEEQVEVGK